MAGAPGAGVGLDPVLHAPARLKIMMVLAATPLASFATLERDAGLTAGNLAAHLRALEGAGYAESIRGLVDLRPRMRYRMTDAGREALRAYCGALAAAVRDLERLVGPGE